MLVFPNYAKNHASTIDEWPKHMCDQGNTRSMTDGKEPTRFLEYRRCTP